METKFICLHEVDNKTTLWLNVQHIVAIRDLRTDPVVKKREDGWQWTNIECVNGVTYNVSETECEIYKILQL